MSAIVENAEAAAATEPEPAVEEEDNQPELKTGLLSKRSRNRGMFSMGRIWQERKISLYPSNILYSLPDGTPKDRVPLLKTSTVEPAEVDGKSWAFKVTTGDEELYLNCISKEERNTWINAIQFVIDPSLDVEGNKRRTMQMQANQMEMLRIQQEAIEAKRKLFLPTTKTIECDKKLDTDSKYTKRYAYIDPAAKEVHWSKSEIHTFNSKGLHVIDQVSEVKQLSENSLALVLRDDVEQPLFPKGVFSTQAKEVIFWFKDPAMCALYIGHIEFLRKGPLSALPATGAGSAAGTA